MKSALLFTGALLFVCAIWLMSPYILWNGSAVSFLMSHSSDYVGAWRDKLVRMLFSPIMVISLALVMSGLLLSAGLTLYRPIALT